ncbi:MAG: hypothetical protein IRY91_07240, partial [Gemmatimonadaceae bacterium]|nr:hypothetical protein [Gemmatimonadaceae bacterium]
VGGGLKLDVAGFSIVGSGYYGDGVGTTFMFGQSCCALDVLGQKRKSWGYIGQATYTPPGSKWTIGGSWGDSRLKTTDNDPPEALNSVVKSNRAADGILIFQWTKALKWVAEYTFATSEAFSGAKTKSNQGTTGFMLFF